MLHEPERHEPLRRLAWDPARAQRVIDAIVDETEATFDGTGWPVHPNDLGPGEDPSTASTSLYYGTAGVVWALRHLHARRRTTPTRDWNAVLPKLVQDCARWLASIGSDDCASFLMGDTPVLMMLQQADPDASRADAIAARIAGNVAHPARELMWGSPGTMLAASFLHDRDADTRWAELFRSTAQRLDAELRWSPSHRCRYWEQDLYGRRSRYLDAVHGFVGTAQVLIRGRRLLPPAAWDAWSDTIVQTVTRTATREDGHANWPPELREPGDAGGRWLMQYCHGAPGFVIALADFPGDALDALLAEAGEAVFAAGPLVKGANLCHGTAGNAYALLKLHARTGEVRWRERARLFAMHAIGQAEDDRRRHGRWRYSLWTGDLGVAVFLQDCIDGRAAFPTLDVFDEPPAVTAREQR